MRSTELWQPTNSSLSNSGSSCQLGTFIVRERLLWFTMSYPMDSVTGNAPVGYSGRWKLAAVSAIASAAAAEAVLESPQLDKELCFERRGSTGDCRHLLALSDGAWIHQWIRHLLSNKGDETHDGSHGPATPFWDSNAHQLAQNGINALIYGSLTWAGVL